MSMSQKLKQLRKQNKLSQEKLAELLGISRQAVSKWENGISRPETKNLIKISEIYNISLEELVDSRVSQPEKVTDDSKKQVFKIPMFVIVAYLTSFVSIVGFFCPPISNTQQPKMFWIVVALIGGCLLLIKNSFVQDKLNVMRVLGLDTSVIALGCILGVAIPNRIGLAKQVIIVIPLAIYYSYITRKYFKQIKKQEINYDN